MDAQAKTELQAWITKWFPQNSTMVAKHLNAHAQAAQTAADGNTYVVFPDEQDANYGNPNGAPSTDDGSSDGGGDASGSD